MMINKNKTTIGLFGTCGNSQWREKFIQVYKENGVNYFNPQLPEGTWTPECADIENQHFLKDDIILFPVTYETTAFGSLGEVGFSIQSLLNNPSKQRYFVFLIDDECLDNKASKEQINDSNRTRKLVKSKLTEQNHSNIFIVNTLDEMLDLSLELLVIMEQWQALKLKYAS